MVVLDRINSGGTAASFGVDSAQFHKALVEDNRRFIRRGGYSQDYNNDQRQSRFGPVGYTGIAEFDLRYNPALPGSIAVFDEAKAKLAAIAPSPQKSMMQAVMNSLEDSFNNHLKDLREVPKLKLALNKLDDGALLLEWSYKNIRILFSVEEDIKSSSFCALTADADGSIFSFADDLSYENIDSCVNTAVRVVVAHV